MASSIENVFFNNVTGGTIQFGDISYSTITCTKTVNESGANNKDIFSLLNNLLSSNNFIDEKAVCQSNTDKK